ncbi:hypothetical protein LC653_18360 [Nostoc sp. CHAB 5784]|nr:hypothetical protein [Nostoc mirabile CHAB5784]
MLALEIKNEDAHQKVLQNWATLIKSKPFLITKTYIFDEVVTFFNSRNLHYKAVEVGNRLLESPDIELIEIDRTLFNQGWEYFQKHKDKSYSLTDCLSFNTARLRIFVGWVEAMRYPTNPALRLGFVPQTPLASSRETRPTQWLPNLHILIF